MEKQGYIWDFRQQRIMIEDGEWLELKHEPEGSGLRRIYASEDTLLPPAQHRSKCAYTTPWYTTPRSLAFAGLLENDQVSGLPQVYSARILFPAKFTGIKIPLLNTEKWSQIVPKDTDLGEVHAAEIAEVVANVEENPRNKS